MLRCTKKKKAEKLLVVILLGIASTPANAIIQQLFTTNAVCKQNHCINPIFPGLLEFGKLSTMSWKKQNSADIASVLDFCGQVITYDPGLPSPNKTNVYSSDEVLESAIEHDRSAAELFFYHLQGMGIEAWDHRDPFNVSSHPLRPCARSVARLACFTYFPKAALTAQVGDDVSYLRPCSSCCQEYIDACQVECCDESVQCVFSQAQTDDDGTQSSPGLSPTIGNADSAKVSLLSDGQLTGFGKGTAPSLGCTGTKDTSGTLQLLQVQSTAAALRRLGLCSLAIAVAAVNAMI
jgi:hypothetical protein